MSGSDPLFGGDGGSAAGGGPTLPPALPELPIPTCACCGAPAPRMCSGCYGAQYCGMACQRAHWPAHKSLCTGSLCVFWGSAHSSPDARGEFFEVRHQDGGLYLRGEGSRARLAPFVTRSFARFPTPEGELIKGALLHASSGYNMVQVLSWSKDAFFVLRRRSFRRYGAPPGVTVVDAKRLHSFSFAVVLSNGDVYAWGQGKGSCHNKPDARVGMDDPYAWEPFVGCLAPMLATSVMAAVPPGDRVVRAVWSREETAVVFFTLRGARVAFKMAEAQASRVDADPHGAWVYSFSDDQPTGSAGPAPALRVEDLSALLGGGGGGSDAGEEDEDEDENDEEEEEDDEEEEEDEGEEDEDEVEE